MKRLCKSAIAIKTVASALVAAALLSSTSYAGATTLYRQTIASAPTKECWTFLIWGNCAYNLTSKHGFSGNHAKSSRSEIAGGDSRRASNRAGGSPKASAGGSPKASAGGSPKASNGLNGQSSSSGGHPSKPSTPAGGSQSSTPDNPAGGGQPSTPSTPAAQPSTPSAPAAQPSTPSAPARGNPGNNKSVGNAGENPNGKDGWGGGSRGRNK
jgi:hypothetical protein